jgi:hypothetical protein
MPSEENKEAYKGEDIPRDRRRCLPNAGYGVITFYFILFFLFLAVTLLDLDTQRQIDIVPLGMGNTFG